jgi:predicted deacetylase
VYFCIRDDDTSYFTSPEELEQVYGHVTKHGPVSLAIVPFCQAGTSRWLPCTYRERWSIHPLDQNKTLVEYLRQGIAEGRYEAMLHGYHHDEPGMQREFVSGSDLVRKVREGKRYLEELLCTRIRVFVPPHNAIGKRGLEALNREGLHLAGVAGLRGGWPLAPSSLKMWWRIRKWKAGGHTGIPWIVDLAKHREMAGTPVTPLTDAKDSLKGFDEALEANGVFCAATHYWEFSHASRPSQTTTVGDHLMRLVERATSDPRVIWRSVGDVLSG